MVYLKNNKISKKLYSLNFSVIFQTTLNKYLLTNLINYIRIIIVSKFDFFLLFLEKIYFMKILIVYYSMLGNTEFVARQISDLLDADLLRLEPVKKYPDEGIKKFFWGGKSAVMAEKPKLLQYIFKSDSYDIVIFGTPIWAGNIAPPLRTFISENTDNLKNKKFAVFTCSSGGGSSKASKQLKHLLSINNFAAELSLIDPKSKLNKENTNKIKTFCSNIKN